MLEKEILEVLQTLESTDDIKYLAKAAETNEDVFDALWHISKTAEERCGWYAVWALEHSVKANNQFLHKVKDQLYALIPLQTHPGKKRGLFNLVTHTAIDDEKIMPVFDKAMEWLKDPKEAAAIRAQAVRLFFEIYKMDPEFKYELDALLRQQLNNNASTGLKNVMNRVIKAMKNGSFRL